MKDNLLVGMTILTVIPYIIINEQATNLRLVRKRFDKVG